MAKQTGKTKLVGRVGDVIYYKMGGSYYARAVSSLSGRRVKRDPRFKRTMEFAKLFGLASKIASELYRSLPPKQRNYTLYRKITGQANQWLMKGMEEADVMRELKQKFMPVSSGPIGKRTSVQRPAAARFNAISNGKTISQKLFSSETRRPALPYLMLLTKFNCFETWLSKSHPVSVSTGLPHSYRI